METHHLVLPEHLNQFGHLFGGRLLAWVDEASWIAATVEHPGTRLVTVAMDEVVFRHGVKEGAILRIASEKVAHGTTSVTYRVQVSRVRDEQREVLFSTRVTFVNLDERGQKCVIPGSS